MLFDLYRKVKKKPVYEALAEHFTRRYKRPMVKWEETLNTPLNQMPLDGFPEIESRVRAAWGQQGGLEYIHTMLCSREQPDEIVFNATLQRELLQMSKVFPLKEA